MVVVRDGKVPMYISEYYLKGVCIRIIWDNTVHVFKATRNPQKN